ncbi:MAG: ribonuclease D [Candidatus Thiodiazotropha sp. (ex Lucinoma aequizonata)]|nr:ribonuclease D [Candidatus Thiodiazotropha sp. (ex Lucinoma aequizonata)]MCU7888201.1 ribonuclease D [Candidatus Thiodiazotropha sp. (ex Lucinoma aequizonata)]MCU7896674.1 ribonuclease D [Candidatus Thiodiazotropha sp. (ex Lucinoma aequizonata)]MCU7898118.1 ribonuclease D [Candidatus Thiodiazotropha sp. (ex Lucinoma aequizonata)]MCU7900760.1 ribonuclease D [Candidatus Thiodiazotropha sp. (ex Lucinoma aequizonata)]
MQEHYIDTPSQLQCLCDQIRHSPWLTLDTEFVREKTYTANLCLVQLCNGELAACIDPLVLKDLTPLLEILMNPQVIKIFHAGHQDLEIFYQLWGQLPEPLFDTQIAAMLLGHREQIGYANLVQQLLGRELEKGYTRTDWSSRPLNSAQLRYALDDVIYLGEIYLTLESQLRERQRETWLQEELKKLSDPTTYVNSPDQMWKRIRGQRHLKGTQRAVLQVLAAWREDEAQRANRPRRWILKDEVLLELARRQSTDITGLEHIHSLEPGTIQRWGNRLLQLIADSKALPKAQWLLNDARPPQLSHEQSAQMDRLLDYLQQTAEEEVISPTLLVNRRDLERLVAGERELPVLQGWRWSLVGERLLDML